MRSRVSCSAARLVLEERIADDRLRWMLVSNVILYIKLLFTKFAAVRALEARWFATIILEVGRDGALCGIALAAARTREASPHSPRVPTAESPFRPWQW